MRFWKLYLHKNTPKLGSVDTAPRTCHHWGLQLAISAQELSAPERWSWSCDPIMDHIQHGIIILPKTSIVSFSTIFSYIHFINRALCLEKAKSTSFLLFWDLSPQVPLDIALSDMYLFTLFTQPKYQYVTKSHLSSASALHLHKAKTCLFPSFLTYAFWKSECIYVTLFINPLAYSKSWLLKLPNIIISFKTWEDILYPSRFTLHLSHLACCSRKLT